MRVKIKSIKGLLAVLAISILNLFLNWKIEQGNES